MIIPPSLQPGDCIGITCPAGSVVLDEMEAMFSQLREWGYQLRIGETIGTSQGKFSASDDIRLRDLQQMLDDPTIKAILFGRGGYGVVRIIDRIDFTAFKNNPKWLLGYSDITCFHSHLNHHLQVASIHGHMGSAYREENRDEFSTQQIHHLLKGIPSVYNLPSHPMNRTGVREGMLAGGNLALLSDLVGTPSDIQTKGCILLIEDIGEYKYNIDRMMWQLLRAGKLENLSGLLVGGFTDTLDNEIPFGMSVEEIVWEKVRDFNYPVCFNYPAGHQAINYPLKMGGEYRLSITKDGGQLEEIIPT
jgi:muramoyltetrapeptide carboxypeptidase